jgi:hypothetical protein
MHDLLAHASAKVPKSGEVRQGPQHLSRPSNACRDARPIHQCFMSHLHSSRKAFLESSNLTTALRGIARPVLSSMGLMKNIGFCGQWCVIVIFCYVAMLSLMCRPMIHKDAKASCLNSFIISSPSSGPKAYLSSLTSSFSSSSLTTWSRPEQPYSSISLATSSSTYATKGVTAGTS